MKEIIVSTPTYHREGATLKKGGKPKLSGPERLERTIKMLYDNCENPDSFDMQVIINVEQVEIYREIINKYPNLIYTFIEQDKAFKNIIQAQHTQMKKGYYFCINLGDDIYGFNKNWDRHILNKKYFFKDNLFLMYTKSEFSNRKQEIYKNCYDSKDISDKHESVPIWTSKWGEFTYNLFDEKFDLGREVLYAFMISILYKKGFNRHVSCELDYESFEDDGTTGELLKQYPDFYTDLDIKLNPEIQKMIQHINENKAK